MQNTTQLSSREQDVVHHLMEGKTNKQIASDLNISIRTIEFHLNNIFAKYQVNSRVELVLKIKGDINAGSGIKPVESTVAFATPVAQNDGEFNLKDWVTYTKSAITKIGKKIVMKSNVIQDSHDATSNISFFDAIILCLKKYARFDGRATRPEFWWFALFTLIATSALTLVGETLGQIFLVSVLLPILSAGARRLRDAGKNPWWLLMILAPVGGIVVLGFLWAQPSHNTPPSVSAG